MSGREGRRWGPRASSYSEQLETQDGGGLESLTGHHLGIRPPLDAGLYPYPCPSLQEEGYIGRVNARCRRTSTEAPRHPPSLQEGAARAVKL
jgi:hypothetical protein